MKYDVFISYASEDRDTVARQLADQLRALGLSVWFDQTALKVGDNLRASIDAGLSQSKFGVVILSKYFFAKEWTKLELEGLFSRDVLGGKVILPVWHDVTQEEVSRFSPMLSNRLSADTQDGIPAVAQLLVASMADADSTETKSKAILTASSRINRLPSCPECNVRVSPTAELCPSCGYRLLGRENLKHCSRCAIDVIPINDPKYKFPLCPLCKGPLYSLTEFLLGIVIAFSIIAALLYVIANS